MNTQSGWGSSGDRMPFLETPYGSGTAYDGAQRVPPYEEAFHHDVSYLDAPYLDAAYHEVQYYEPPFAEAPFPGEGSYGAGFHDLAGRRDAEEAHDTMPHGSSFRFVDRPPQDVAEEGVTGWEFEEGLARLLDEAEQPRPVPVPIPRQRLVHRRRPRRTARTAEAIERLVREPFPWLRLVSLLATAVTVTIVAVVGTLGGMIAYDPLRRLAIPGAGAAAAWWPLLVYGPWLVAALSILRAAVHRSRALHSWLLVVVFSAIAVYLCVAHACGSSIRLVVAGLPPVAALVCFHQLVRQITLTNPLRRRPRRPRHTVRRG